MKNDKQRTLRSLLMIALLAMVCVSTTANLSTEQADLWIVTDDRGGMISEHTDQSEAQAAARAWAVANPGLETSIQPPRSVLKYEPDAPISIDVNAIPSELTTGQQVSVPVSGIAEGEIIWFHLFDLEWENLVRSDVVVTGSQIKLEIPNVDGERILQLQYRGQFKTKTAVSISPSEAAAPEGDPADIDPDKISHVIELGPGNQSLVIPRNLLSPDQWLVVRGTKQSLIQDMEVDWDAYPAKIRFEGVTIQSKISGRQIDEFAFVNCAFDVADSVCWGVHLATVVDCEIVSQGDVFAGGVWEYAAARNIVHYYREDLWQAGAGELINTLIIEHEPYDDKSPNVFQIPDGGDLNKILIRDLVGPEPLPETELAESPDIEDSGRGLAAPPMPAQIVSADASELRPGKGWAGPTPTPGQIGDVHERAIAHWNVVPEQEVADGFTVGVIAHHMEGIDRVKIAVNGGDWVTITKPTINPRTRCEEYFAKLDLDGFNGPLKLRAIAYPKQGKPHVVETLGRGNASQDLTLFTEFVGAVLELDAGEQTLTPRDLPATGWLVVRPKPGVSREDVVLVGASRTWPEGRLKLENLTIKLPAGGGGLLGKYKADEIGNHVWLDNCRVYGNGPAKQTWWIAHQWETQSFTDCEISDIQTAFNGDIGLIRNCYVHDIYEDVFRMMGLQVNVTIEDVDRQPMVDAQGGNPHPDVWQRPGMNDTIAQDITALKNIHAQGFFGGVVSDVALVRIDVKTVYPYNALQIMDDVKNLLVADSRFQGSARLRGEVVPGERMMYRDLHPNNAWPNLPHGWDKEGVQIVPPPPVEAIE